MSHRGRCKFESKTSRALAAWSFFCFFNDCCRNRKPFVDINYELSGKPTLARHVENVGQCTPQRSSTIVRCEMIDKCMEHVVSYSGFLP